MQAPLQHLEDCKGICYRLQMNMYRKMLEKNYGVVVASMHVVCFHPEVGTYPFIDNVPSMDQEVEIIFAERRGLVYENKSMAASAEPPMKRQRRSRSRRSSTTSSNNSNSGSNNSSSSATILSPSAAPPRRSSRNRNILRLNISYLGDNEMLMQSLSEEQQIKLAMAASMEDQQQN